MSETCEPLELLTTAAIARRLDISHVTAKRRLLQRAVRADGIQLPAHNLLYAADRLAELREVILAEPEAVSVNTEPRSVA